MKIKVAYSHIENAGDLLNIYIMKNIFGVEICHSGYLSSELAGIGSFLGEYQYSDHFSRRMKQILYPKHKTTVWGTGFMYSERPIERPFFNRNLRFAALRGRLSKNRVERLIGRALPELPLCDGGILTSLLFAKKIEKEYELGIIPHYREQDEAGFERLSGLSNKSIIIDLKKDPMEVYRKIASCEYVLSSSLHGLVISDSFGIPNLHVKVSDKLMGDGFKFRDYYSCYGLQDDFVRPSSELLSINYIIDHYKVPRAEVEKKKKEMYDCFPFIQSKI